ncbi:MAG: S8 family serine peptidase [Prevotella sp.]|nr:S8 family serine peptidase [Prevotella sp.]
MKRLVFIIAMAAVCSLSFAQGDNSRKLSLTTKMFLSELKDGGFDHAKQAERLKARRARGEQPVMRRSKNDGRIYAAPDTINGRAYISAFIRLDDSNNTSAIEALGVQVQCRFKNGLITANIPVDKLHEVASLNEVKELDVATLMKPCTDLARKRTNVDDILNTTFTIREGIDEKIDGSGVLLAVIDEGIDFSHIAFKDKEGKNRILRIYVYDGINEELTEMERGSSWALDFTDNPLKDHGTHTASTAGGSSIIIDGSNVTVTDNHANATYGGMAPAADLILCGVKDLKNTYIANAFYQIIQWTDDLDMPLVVSNSYSNQVGPHDGVSGKIAEVCNQFFDDKPNRICLFSAGNEADKSKEGGGKHILADASADNPIGAIIRSSSGGNSYNGAILGAWARSSCKNGFICHVYILNNSTGAVLADVNIGNWDNTIGGIENYYSGSLTAYYNDYGTKQGVVLYADDMKANGNYSLAFEISPVNGSSAFDLWAGESDYLTNHLLTENHNWIAGSDDMSVGDEATIENVISIGAYVSRIKGKDYKGNEHQLPDEYRSGDIAPFSGFATVGQSPTGQIYPWITAPGTLVVAAVNHFHDKDGYIDDTYNDYNGYRINKSKTSPYGTMNGTSMATPVAAGIVALWLQAAKEKGLQLTTSKVKDIMWRTSIVDNFVQGANSYRFGNGKIDALAGLNYILNPPTIEPSTTNIVFHGEVGETISKTIKVKMLNVESNVTVRATLSDENGVFSIDKPTIVVGENGTDITVTWSPTEVGTTSATLTLFATDAADVVVHLEGNVLAPPAISVNTNRLEFTAKPHGVSTRTLTVQGYRLREDAVLFTGKNDGVFSINKTDIPAKYLDEPTTVIVSFSPKSTGNFTDTLTIVSGNATNKISLYGSAGDAGTLARFEYWFDDETPGNKTITLNGTEDVIDSEIDTEALTVGVHTLHVRAIQTDGEYSCSPVSTTLFFKRPIGTANQIEYWFDDDRDNIGMVSGTLDGQKYEFISDLNLDDVTPGHHRLYLRAVSGDKKVVGAVTSVPVIVKSLYAGDATMASFSIVVDDKTVAFGPLASEKVVNFSYVLDVSELSLGTHQLKTTFWNSLGLSMTEQTPFKVVEVVKVFGDVNLDGTVDVADIASVITVMAGSAGVSSAQADVNGDGVVDVADIATIISEMAARARMLNETEE